MRLTFLGGTETVTGSKFLLETDDQRVLVDCGLFQGYKWLRERNWQPLPLDIKSLDAVILTHAHLDHSGYLPVLYKNGYRGPVFTHPATVDLCRCLLVDSGHLQEEDARFYGRHKLGRHTPPRPLYDARTAEECMSIFQPVGFDEQVEVGDLEFHLQPAGHILGAASIILRSGDRRVGISGDVGRPDDILMHPPRPLPELDLLLLESTYGDRRHEQTDPFEQLADVVRSTAARGGVLLIPSFTVGRAQLLLHMLDRLMEESGIPEMPIYLDSPMAIDVSEIYRRHVDQHRLTEAQCERMFRRVNFTREVEESRALEGIRFPHIIIAGSGMATGGRILHHFKRLLPDPKTAVLFAGYQAGGTRGAKMVAGAESVRIHGDWIPVRAQVSDLHGLSAHADHVQIGAWLQRSGIDRRTAVHLVHGEPEALEAQRDYLIHEKGLRVHVGDYHGILTL